MNRCEAICGEQRFAGVTILINALLVLGVNCSREPYSKSVDVFEDVQGLSSEVQESSNGPPVELICRCGVRVGIQGYIETPVGLHDAEGVNAIGTNERPATG